MPKPAASLPLPRGAALKWLMAAAIVMAALTTIVATAAVQAQSSNAPNPPTGLMTELATPNSIKIAWQPPAPNNCQVSRYNILAEAQLSNAYVIDDFVPASQLWHKLDNLDPATPHEIRVYANSKDVGCDRSSTPALLTVTTQAGPAPSNPRTESSNQPVAPKQLNLPSQPQNVNYEITHNQLTVTWLPGSVSGGCQVKDYVAILIEDWDGGVIDPTKYREQLIAVDASPAAIFGNLKPETRYYTYLAARGNASCDGHGYSPKVEHYFTTKARPTPPPTATPRPTPTPTPDPLEETIRDYDKITTQGGGTATPTPSPRREIEVVKDGATYGKGQGQTPKLTIPEGDSETKTVPLTLRLTGAPSYDVSVRVKFQKPNDTNVRGRKNAGADRDFYFMDQVITWEAGASGAALTKTVNLRIIGDTRSESNETVRFSVNRLTTDDRNVRLSGNRSRILVQVVIENDD